MVKDRGELGSTQEQLGGVVPGLSGDRWPKECPWLLKSSAESPGAPPTKPRCPRDLWYQSLVFCHYHLMEITYGPASLSKVGFRISWAGLGAHPMRFGISGIEVASRHLRWASCCAGVSLATAERSLLVTGPPCSPHLHPKLRSPEEGRREGRGERENKRMRISQFFFFFLNPP